MIHYKKWVSSLNTSQKRGHLAFQPRQSGSVLDSAPYKPDRQLLFTIVVWMSRGKETWDRISQASFANTTLYACSAMQSCSTVLHSVPLLCLPGNTNKWPHRRLGPKASISLGNITQAILGPTTHAWGLSRASSLGSRNQRISSGFPGWEWK